LPGLASPGSEAKFVGDRYQNQNGDRRYVTVDDSGNLGTAKFDPSVIEKGLYELGKQIESVGALASALSAIPNTLPLGVNNGCGVGTGVYGGAWAGALGCVTRVNRTITLNAGAAFTSATSSIYSNSSSFMGRLGLFFQF
ncbi:MAG: YadA-like family protein, partial [Sphaerospermopsis kisseleviana]